MSRLPKTTLTIYPNGQACSSNRRASTNWPPIPTTTTCLRMSSGNLLALCTSKKTLRALRKRQLHGLCYSRLTSMIPMLKSTLSAQIPNYFKTWRRWSKKEIRISMASTLISFLSMWHAWMVSYWKKLLISRSFQRCGSSRAPMPTSRYTFRQHSHSRRTRASLRPCI